ncbi:hypothetical protein Goshw_004685 [Gossypium schwendimanii]|uniref:Ribosomal protein L10e/L16 domain-containing protein n=1 Tax=Gossypium schwendimanii TaxID=34291 RepID=A0A7J9MYE1_GOSSC|nr:hypothetical protein [Gossypium schwendimanii]
MTRNVRRGGKIWVRIFPDKPVTVRPTETRMGSGKGSPEYWVAVVKPGRILYEMSRVAEIFLPSSEIATIKPIKLNKGSRLGERALRTRREENKFMDGIKYVVVTDKSIWLLVKNQYTSNVELRSTRTEIKHWVELFFDSLRPCGFRLMPAHPKWVLNRGW